MELTVLGGSAASVNPGLRCSGCSIETAAARCVLDLDPGTLPDVRRDGDFWTPDAIITSHLHLHLVHVLDPSALRSMLAYNQIRARRPIGSARPDAP